MTSFSIPRADLTEGRQGHYAGAASRFAAFAIDVAASWGIYTGAITLISLASELVTGRSLNMSHNQELAGIVLVVWEFAYYSYQWALSGKTIGMALMGIQVVRADGRAAGTRRAVYRTLAFPLSFLCLGLGFTGILVQRHRQALHDVIANTAVVYSWDARAARLRWLARQDPGPSVRREPHG